MKLRVTFYALNCPAGCVRVSGNCKLEIGENDDNKFRHANQETLLARPARQELPLTTLSAATSQTTAVIIYRTTQPIKCSNVPFLLVMATKGRNDDP